MSSCPTGFMCMSWPEISLELILRIMSGRRQVRTSGRSGIPALVSTWHTSRSTLTITPTVVGSSDTRSSSSYGPKVVWPVACSAHSTRSRTNTFTSSCVMSVKMVPTPSSTCTTMPVSPSWRPVVTLTWSPRLKNLESWLVGKRMSSLKSLSLGRMTTCPSGSMRSTVPTMFFRSPSDTTTASPAWYRTSTDLDCRASLASSDVALSSSSSSLAPE
mmetsp:Transcript_6096/g.10571  ORF Transcript_6096/g.10571 Transcript_6096/m.10571 type:complete len:216 (-) Transcript_6096:1626-2273(-)